MIKAQVIADSKNEFGNRITTMLVTFPRYILAELNTHRMLSKNSASSRAIPFEKMLASVESTPFVPMAWMEHHNGMQGDKYITNPNKIQELEDEWHYAKNSAIENAQSLFDNGVTKQIVNRLLEPFMYHTVLITATEWENFFYLRCPQYSSYDRLYRSKKDVMRSADIQDFEDYKNFGLINWLQINKGQADIHMMALAEAMWDAYNESTPKELKAGEWHIPFGDDINLPPTIPIEEGLTLKEGVNIRKVKIATARCARTSYTVIGAEGKALNIEKDIELHDRLATSGHWSPFEHCAKAMSTQDFDFSDMKRIEDKFETGWSGNFKGFIQYRKTFEGENKDDNRN